MPFFASFEDMGGLAALFAALLLLPVAAGLALIALILAFWPRTRFASMCCAIACAVTSLPLVLINVSLVNKGGYGLLQVAFFLAPLFVAVAVCWFDFCFLVKERKPDETNSEIRSGGTGP